MSPYIIGELSANHNGSLDRAIKLIKMMKDAGADAVKIQTYKPDTLTFNSDLSDFIISDGLWAGQTLYSLYESAQTPWEWHEKLFKVSKELGITMFSSPFDKSAVDLLEDLNAPAYKIASFEIIDLELIGYAASTRKPLIISTGMAGIADIEEAIDVARSSGCNDIALLHCVSAYPASPDEYNLMTIPDMTARFGVPVGLSDHTLGMTTALSSVAMGACIIEKHITESRDNGGPDDSFSITPAELMDLCLNTKIAHQAIGKVNYSLTKSEKPNLKFRRSLYYAKDLRRGDKIEVDSVRCVRPGYGAPPKMLHNFIGKVLKVDVDKFTPVKITDIDLDA
jgi:N-acetylneuraminate synthase